MIKWFLFGLVLTLAAFAASLYVNFAMRDSLLERVPIHWNASMEPDRFADRDDVLGFFLIIPGVMALLTSFMLILHGLSFKKPEINRFANIFGIFLSAVIVLLAYLLYRQLLAAMR